MLKGGLIYNINELEINRLVRDDYYMILRILKRIFRIGIANEQNKIESLVKGLVNLRKDNIESKISLKKKENNMRDIYTQSYQELNGILSSGSNTDEEFTVDLRNLQILKEFETNVLKQLDFLSENPNLFDESIKGLLVSEYRIEFSVVSHHLEVANLRKHPKLKLLEILNDNFNPKINFDIKVIDILISKKVDHKLADKFLKKIIELENDQAIFRENTIQVGRSENLLEVKVFKDWRIYILPKGQSYIIYDFGHKNTQKRDIMRLRRKIS
jgi:hypothetical protein